MLNSGVDALFCSFFTWLFFHSGPYTKCRTIDNFESLHTCKPYLNNETLYYNPYADNDFRIKAAMAPLQPGLSKDCTSNLFWLLCRSWFRECRKARDGSSGLKSVVLPSLMVREAAVITPQKPSRDSLTLCLCSAVRNVKSMLINGRIAPRGWMITLDNKWSVILSVSWSCICICCTFLHLRYISDT